MKPWTQVVESPEYRKLSFEEREQARQQYFNDVVAPRVPGEDLETVRGQFDADTAQTTGPQRNLGEQIVRGVGRTVRAGLKGVTAIPAMVGDALGMDSSGAVDRLADLVGLPKAENATERVAEDVASAMAIGGGTQGIGRLMAKSTGPVVSRIGDLLRAQPMLQTVGAGTGAGAAAGTREAGGGPGAQTVAGIAGALTPAAITAGPQMAIRGALRGGEQGRERVATNIREFVESGYGTPSVGQASEARLPQAIESVLSKTPGGAGPMARRAEAGATNLGAKVGELADDLSPRATATKAGAAIEKGVKSFVDRFKGEQRFLYDKLDTHIPKGKPVDLTNTINKLGELNADIPGAPELSKFFKNSTIQGIEGAMKSDTKDFSTRLPYEAMKKLRTLVGAELENTSLTSSVPRSKWKALYAALSQDLSEAASEAGPEAQKAYQRANRYASAGHDRIGTYLDRVAGKDTVEKVFQAAVNPSEIREGSSTVNAVMRSLDKGGRDVVRAAFLKRLGQALPGAQDELGEVFSPERFLTNWNRISPEAKMTLFADQSGTLKRDLDQIARVAANLREGSRVFANPSGTQPAISSQIATGGVLLAPIMGHPSIAAAIAGGALTANVTARLMTAPWFVNWLAKATTAPVGAIPAQLNALATLAQSMPDEDREAVAEFIQGAREANRQLGQGRR